MHRSSLTKLYIPFDNPRYGDMSNSFSYLVEPTLTTEFTDLDCTEDKNDHVDNSRDCYAEYLEDKLGCKLPWDTDSSESSKNLKKDI